jgi:hypothetical protein
MNFLSLIDVAQVIPRTEGYEFPRNIEHRNETSLRINFPTVLYGVEDNGRNNSTTNRTRRSRAMRRTRNERVPPLHNEDKSEPNPEKVAG